MTSIQHLSQIAVEQNAVLGQCERSLTNSARQSRYRQNQFVDDLPFPAAIDVLFGVEDEAKASASKAFDASNSRAENILALHSVDQDGDLSVRHSRPLFSVRGNYTPNFHAMPALNIRPVTAHRRANIELNAAIFSPRTERFAA